MNFQNNSNPHPEMNDENHEFNSNVPKTIQELLLMQKRNETEIYSNGIKSLADMPYLKDC